MNNVKNEYDFSGGEKISVVMYFKWALFVELHHMKDMLYQNCVCLLFDKNLFETIDSLIYITVVFMIHFQYIYTQCFLICKYL